MGQSQLFLVHIQERLIIVRRDLNDWPVSIRGNTSLETVIIANGMDTSLIVIPEFKQACVSEIYTLKDLARVLDVRLSTHESD